MILLDTHFWIWWLVGTPELSAAERAELDRLAARGEVAVAAMSLWETQMLHAKGRLMVDRSFEAWIRDAAASVRVIPIDVDVIIALDGLPPSFHGDPADRLIVATARSRRFALATRDKQIRRSRAVKLWPSARKSRRVRKS